MTETPKQNNEIDGTPLNQPVPSAERTTLDFVTAINSFHWKADYFKFCLVLGLIPDSYAEEKYSQFQELISNLNQFDMDMLTRMIQSWDSK